MAGWRPPATAASTMYSGVGKAGPPAPKPMTGLPAAFRAFALASTARVADSVIAAIRREMRRCAGGRSDWAAGSVEETAVMGAMVSKTTPDVLGSTRPEPALADPRPG